jgi:hypothetical protein
LVVASLAALGLTIVLGLAALGLVSLVRPGPFLQAAGRIPASRYWFGIVELAFYFVCLFGYLWIDKAPRPLSAKRRWCLAGLLWLAGTDVAYHFPPLFAMISVMSTRPATGPEPVRFLAMMFDPEVLAFTLHFLVASVAVGGLAVTLLARRGAANESNREAAARLAIAGGRIALMPTLVQLLVGMFVLLQLPDASRELLLGGDWIATGLFGAALVAALALMHRLAAISLGELGRAEVIGSAVLLALVIALMVGAQHRSREMRYGPPVAATSTVVVTRRVSLRRYLFVFPSAAECLAPVIQSQPRR